MKLLFHLFKIQNSHNYINGYGIFSLWQPIWNFETYSESMKDFDSHFYLIILLIEEAHANFFAWVRVLLLSTQISSMSIGLRATM